MPDSDSRHLRVDVTFRVGRSVEGYLMLAFRIAAAWTLLSFLLVGFWVVGLEVAKRFGSKL